MTSVSSLSEKIDNELTAVGMTLMGIREERLLDLLGDVAVALKGSQHTGATLERVIREIEYRKDLMASHRKLIDDRKKREDWERNNAG